MCVLINPLIFFQTPPGGVFAVPQEVAVLIGHFSWNADLVAVEVVGLLAAFTVFGCPIANLCWRIVGIRVGIDIGISAVRVDFLPQMAAVLYESSFLFEAVWSFSVFLEDFGFNQFIEARLNLQLAYY